MKQRDDLPATPDWQVEARAWDEAACCPACPFVCDPEDHAIGPNIELGGRGD